MSGHQYASYRQPSRKGGSGKALLSAALVVGLVCWGFTKLGFSADSLSALGGEEVDSADSVDVAEASIPCEVDDTIGLTSERLQTCIDAKEYAASQLSPEEFICLEEMWTRESRWSAWAVNDSSGTYGIPQIHPDVHGYPVEEGDWKAQVDWGLDYIKRNHDTPCAAWEFWQRTDSRCLPVAEQCMQPYGEHWY